MNILIIEDDEFLSRKIKVLFEKKSEVNIVKIINNYKDFTDNYHLINTYDVILVDIYLSKSSNKDTGLEIIKLIRIKNKYIPIIIISGLNDIGWLRLGFDCGANDYICKPFRLAELEIRVFKRIKDYLKIQSSGIDDILEYKGLQYNFNNNTFNYNGVQLELTKSNKSILLLFLCKKEEILSDMYLIEKIWGDRGEQIDRNIRVTLSRLKKSLEKYGIVDWIYNIRGEGYILKK